MKRLASTAPFVLALSALSAASFFAAGCTIYTYDSPPPKARPAKAKPAATTSTPTKGPVIGRGNRRASGAGGSATSTEGTPVVAARTIFGTPTVAAFKGEAFVIPEGTKT